MTERIKLVQGDTRPQLQLTLTDEGTEAAIDITGAVCTMKFRAAGETTVLDTLTGVVTNGPGGVVVFFWNSTTLDVPAGDYEGEVSVAFPNGGGLQTVYEILKFRLREDF
jgi:hypothetical protein